MNISHTPCYIGSFCFEDTDCEVFAANGLFYIPAFQVAKALKYASTRIGRGLPEFRQRERYRLYIDCRVEIPSIERIKATRLYSVKAIWCISCSRNSLEEPMRFHDALCAFIDAVKVTDGPSSMEKELLSIDIQINELRERRSALINKLNAINGGKNND